MNFLESRVCDLEDDQLEASNNGFIPAVWPVSGDDIARRNNQ